METPSETETAAASASTPARPEVVLPRWLVRTALILCPYFALLIGGHALSMLLLDPFRGIGGVLTFLFWLGVTGFSITVLVMGLLYLRMETGMTRASRWRWGSIFALIMLSVGALAVANMLLM